MPQERQLDKKLLSEKHVKPEDLDITEATDDEIAPKEEAGKVLEFRRAAERAEAEAAHQADALSAEISQSMEVPGEPWLDQYQDPHLRRYAHEKYTRLMQQIAELKPKHDSKGFLRRLWERTTGAYQAEESRLEQMNQALAEILEGRLETLVRAEQSGQARYTKKQESTVDRFGQPLEAYGEDVVSIDEIAGTAIIIDGMSGMKKGGIDKSTAALMEAAGTKQEITDDSLPIAKEIASRLNRALQEIPSDISGDQAVAELTKSFKNVLNNIELEVTGGAMILAVKYLPDTDELLIIDIGNCQLALQGVDKFSDIKLDRGGISAFQTFYDKKNKKIGIYDNRPNNKKTPYIYSVPLANFRTDSSQPITLFMGSDGLNETNSHMTRIHDLEQQVQRTIELIEKDEAHITEFREKMNATNDPKIREGISKQIMRKELRLSGRQKTLAVLQSNLEAGAGRENHFGSAKNLTECAPVLLERGTSAISALPNTVDDISIIRLDIPPKKETRELTH
ncbi:MAG: hypothetical protein WC752_02205 [Patescibacteria group bacterium]|jgi:hypothetical protein